ncbi:aminotransferase class IV [Oscillospiraceae bacterium CM]|nr:aminotransferase class IV [Oscillospiraceae bacterium CM]
MIFVNGQPSASGQIALDSGYSFGRGVFETILVKEKPLFLTRHLERLHSGLHVLNVKNDVSEQGILDLLARHDIKNCVLKIIATEKNIVLTTRDNPYRAEDYKHGFKVRLSHLRRNAHSHTTYIKSLNYSDNLLEREKAAEAGYDEVLFFNTSQELSEGSVSNVFIVQNGKLMTPNVACGLLDGIVRRWVTENFEVSEDRLMIDTLMTAQEVFLTNSIMGVMPVTAIGGTVFGLGPVTETVRSFYEQAIRL